MVDASISDIVHNVNQSNLSRALNNAIPASATAESSPDESSNLPYTPVESISSYSSQEDLLENKFDLQSNDIGHQIDMLFNTSNQVIPPTEVTEQALEKLLDEIENRNITPVEDFDLETVVEKLDPVPSNSFTSGPLPPSSLEVSDSIQSQQTNQHKPQFPTQRYTPQPRGFLNTGSHKRQRVIASSQLQLPGGQPLVQQQQFSGIPTSGLKQLQQSKNISNTPQSEAQQILVSKPKLQAQPLSLPQQPKLDSSQEVQVQPQENKFLKCFSILKSNYLSLCAAHNSLIVRYNNSEVERTKLKVQNEELKGLLDGALHELNCYRNNERKRLHH